MYVSEIQREKYNESELSLYEFLLRPQGIFFRTNNLITGFAVCCVSCFFRLWLNGAEMPKNANGKNDSHLESFFCKTTFRVSWNKVSANNCLEMNNTWFFIWFRQSYWNFDSFKLSQMQLVMNNLSFKIAFQPNYCFNVLFSEINGHAFSPSIISASPLTRNIADPGCTCC